MQWPAEHTATEHTPLLEGDAGARGRSGSRPSGHALQRRGGGRSGSPRRGVLRGQAPLVIDAMPADCWLAVMSYLVRGEPTRKNPLEVDEIWQVMQFAHTSSLLRTLVVHILTNGNATHIERVVCIAVHDDDALHHELAEHCLMRPAKSAAARQLSRGARAAGRAALELLLTVAQSVYLFLFLPTTCTLLGLIRPTWVLWTMSIASVMFIPLFYLGWLASRATLGWWAAINPVRKCPHMNRRATAHCLHPTPWFRIAVIQSLTILVSFVIAYFAYLLGVWLDRQPPHMTQWLLVFLVMCCYCP